MPGPGNGLGLLGTGLLGAELDLTNVDIFAGTYNCRTKPIFVNSLNVKPIAVNSLFVNASEIQANGVVANAVQIEMAVLGSSSNGGFNALNTILTVIGQTGNQTAGYSGNYVSGLFAAQANANDGGTISTPHSGLFGMNANVVLANGATFWSGIIGSEIDVAAETGCSVSDKIGQQIVQTNVDTVNGSRSNIAYTLANQAAAGSGTTGWDIGYCIGANSGFNPIKSTGTLIGTWGHNQTSPGIGSMGTVTNGIDFSQYTFTGKFLKSTGFSVDGTGAIVCTIPSSDPHIVGALWNNSGVVNVSSG